MTEQEQEQPATPAEPGTEPEPVDPEAAPEGDPEPHTDPPPAETTENAGQPLHPESVAPPLGEPQE